jgi:hypothetical protein
MYVHLSIHVAKTGQKQWTLCIKAQKHCFRLSHSTYDSKQGQPQVGMGMAIPFTNFKDEIVECASYVTLPINFLLS